MMRAIAIATAIAGSVALGCGGMSPERGHDTVARLVEARTGYKTRWEKGSPSNDQLVRWVDELLRGGLTRDRAVEIALVNSPRLLAIYEELGVSQADMVQAGLIANPTIGGSVGFPLSGSPGQTEYEASITQDFLSIFVMPLRKHVARKQFLADTLRVAQATMRMAADVKRAMAMLEAHAQTIELRRSILEGADAAADLANRQHEAGNINDLALTREQTVFEEARLDLEHDDLELIAASEEVNRALGLWGPRTTWTLAERLPELPEQDPSLEHLEARAIEQRLDIEAARIQEELMFNALELARESRLFGLVEIGAHIHQDADGPRLVGPTLSLELPIFDQRQALIGRLEAQYHEATRRLDAVSVDARSEVREARARILSARRIVERYKSNVLPLRERAVEQSQLQYNGMQIGLFELVGTKQAQVEANRAYINAVRDYWIARADLELAVGGRIFPKGKL